MSKNGLRDLTIILISLFLSFLNIWHVVWSALILSGQKFNLAVGHYRVDYFDYLFKIGQGFRGRWSISFQNTSENLPDVLVGHWPYILIGKIARIFSLDSAMAYWLAVFILGFLIIWLSYFLIKLVLKNNQHLIIPCYILYVFSGPFWAVKSLQPLEYYNFPITWYSNSNFFARLGNLPHYLTASLLIIILFILSSYFYVEIIQWLTTKTQILPSKKLIFRFLGIFGVFLLIESLSPQRFISLFFGFIFGLLFYLYRGKFADIKKLGFFCLSTFFLGIFLFIFGLFLRNIVGFNYLPEVLKWELSNSEFPTLKHFLLGVGPLLIAAIIGFFFLILRRIRLDSIILFGVFATLASYFFFYLKNPIIFLGHNSRFLGPEGYLFMAMIVVLVLNDLSKKILKGKTIFPLIFSIVLAIYCLPSSILILKEKMDYAFINYYSLDYKMVDGFTYLNTLVEMPKIVLSNPDNFNSLLIPLFSDSKLYYARPLGTINYEEKKEKVSRFYNGVYSLKEQKNFLTQNYIDYVVLYPTDNYLKKFLVFQPQLPLTEVFSNPQILIYKVK